MEDLGLDSRIILKQVLKKLGLFDCGQGSVVVFCEHNNEP
jgi:hypothetical protein